MDRKEPLLIHSASDLEKSAAADAHCPPSPTTRIGWKMRRVISRVISRKHVAAFALLSLLLFLVMNSTKEIPINGLGCPSNRANPHRVAVPSAPNKDHLTKLWSELNALFETHAPSPAHLDTPKHAHGDPPKEKIGSFFNITNEEAQTSREQHEQLVAKLPEYPRGQFKGRGVVMLAGGKYSEYGATSLGMLREVGSKLPIEIWVKDQTEEIPGWCAELAKEGIACRRLADYMDMGVLKHPYQWKVFTILYSSFSEILFLDADSMPVRSPDYLFEAHKYKESGAILWPDYWNHSGSPWAPFITGISGEPHDIMQEKKSVESGQLVWNKERHWKSLLLATYYNYWGPDFFYTVFNNGYAGWGDKDTFPMGLQAMKEPYFMVPHTIHTGFVSGSVLGIGMLQADPENATVNDPLFIHSNIIKWSARDFFCENCEKIANYTPKKAYFTNDKSSIFTHLNEGKRIFAVEGMRDKGIDPEPLMWKCLEHTACRSVWANDPMCERTRIHMERVFGYQFEPLPSEMGGAKIPNNRICIASGPTKSIFDDQR